VTAVGEGVEFVGCDEQVQDRAGLLQLCGLEVVQGSQWAQQVGVGGGAGEVAGRVSATSLGWAGLRPGHGP